MKYYLISGEASGDLHGSNLMKGIKKADSNADFRYWGGDLMENQGGTLVKHYKYHAFMGFITVLLNIKTVLNNLNQCKKDIIHYQPDVVILIDYPGFNLRIAKFVKENGIRVFYYISPKIWAWKQSRIKIIKQYVDKMFVIFPFEKDFYKKFSYPVNFCGNPLLDAIENRENKNELFADFIKRNNLPDKPVIALVPGSRKQEIKNILPVMLSVISNYLDYQFIITGTPSIEKGFYRKIIDKHNVKLIYNETYQIIQQSYVALVTSGTAALETALLNIPQVVCYKFPGGKLGYKLGTKLLKVKYISLVNLIMDKATVKELIQHYLSTVNLKNEIDKILKDKDYKNQMLNDYKDLMSILGGAGASERTAKLMLSYLN
ncbi:MAG: lipid-A-disaccharide synthase [Bacteroidales bacterium]|nr:lipid-A-disaccharide synthase [Bacteroidales bacterium]